MKSLTGKFASARGWALLFTLFLGAGLFVAGCGEEDAPAPTTPAPTPPPPAPEPEPPAPEKPATPTGFQVASKTSNSITWTWNAVEGAHGYVVQTSADEAFDETDALNLTVQPSYTATELAAETSLYARVAAGVATSATPSIDPKDYLLSDWTTHVTGTTDAVAPDRPPAPANVEVKSRGSNYIEWTWDAVAGAAGYSAEFSLTADFLDSREFSMLQKTSLKISNLDAETAGYLRVRSYTGSGTGEDTVFSEWSATGTASTKEQPPAVPLSAPSDVSGGSAQDDTIVVSWDEVDGAASYEVEQRAAGGDWTAATCGAGGDGTVEDTECIATGLSEGTDYDFRVRAIPSDTTKHATGSWAETSARTTGRAPADPVTGGMGDLNVEWESAASGITFLWDRVSGAEYETAVLTTYTDDSEPCKAQNFLNQGRKTSQVVNVTASDSNPMVRGLCVQTKDEANRRLSFAWGAPTPHSPSAGNPTVENAKTTSLPWTGINVAEDFNYAVRLVADTGRDNGMFGSTTVPANAALQKACADGMRLDDGVADVTLTGLTETVSSGIKHFTGYTLCLQYSNDAGATDWAVPNDGTNLTETHTTPAAPPAPRFDRGTNNADGTERTLVWTVPVRNSTDVPRAHDQFEARVIRYPVRRDHDGDSDTPLRTTPSFTVKYCGDSSKDSDNGWTRDTSPTPATSLDGITFTQAITTPDNTAENLNVRLCVRATRGSAGGDAALNGPWRLGGSTTVTKQPAS